MDAVLVVMDAGARLIKHFNVVVQHMFMLVSTGFMLQLHHITIPTRNFLAEEKIVHMRTNLYETKDTKLIWSEITIFRTAEYR